MSKIAVCPKCGSSRRFSEVNTITGLAGVVPEVEADGSVTVEYGGGTDVDWDSQTAVKRAPYICHDCDARFSKFKVVSGS